jgi:hypothetical protein
MGFTQLHCFVENDIDLHKEPLAHEVRLDGVDSL